MGKPVRRFSAVVKVPAPAMGLRLEHISPVAKKSVFSYTYI